MKAGSRARHLWQTVLSLLVLTLLSPGTMVGEEVLMITSFANASKARKYDWVGFAVEEACRRSLRQWEGVALYPVHQPLPDSAEFALQDVPVTDKNWRQGWRTEWVLGGSYDVKRDKIALTLRFRSLKDSGAVITRTLRGNVRSIRNLTADACKAIAGNLQHTLSREDRSRLFAAPTRRFYAYASYATAFGAYKHGNTDRALFALKRALEIDEGFAEAHHLLGMALRRTGRIQEAVTHLYRAIEIRPREILFRTDLADAYLENHQADLAEKIADDLGREGIQVGSIHNLRGLLYMRDGLYSRAISLFVRALGRNPSSWKFAANLGIANYRLGRYNPAISEFERLMRISKTNARYASLLGIAYRKAGYLVESIRVFKQALDLNPQSASLWMNMAVTHAQLGWYHQAEHAIQKALSLDSLQGELYNILGTIRLSMQDTLKAGEAFANALLVEPTCASAWNNQGVLRMWAADYKKAREHFEKALQYGGKQPSVLLNLALANQQLGKSEKATSFLQEAVLIDPSNLNARIRLAQTYQEFGELATAADTYGEYLEIRPESDSARVRLARVLAKMGRKEEAVEHMENVIDRNPGNLGYLLELAHLYREIEWYRVATMKYEQILESRPGHVEALWGVGATHFLAGEENKNARRKFHDRALYYLKAANAEAAQNLDVRYWMGMVQWYYREDADAARQYWEPFLVKKYKGRYAEEVNEHRKALP